ncbi:hypothetical protein O1L55_10400 [Streptomyces albulus]|nr:hypothetical protein [Streptomyces noursei]
MPLHSRTGHTAAVHPRPSPAREARWRAHALQDAVLLLDRYVERAGTGQAPGAGGHLGPGRPGPRPTGRRPRRPRRHGRGEPRHRRVGPHRRTRGGPPGLYDGGLAGTLVGLRQAATLHPALHQVADRLADRLPARILAGAARTTPERSPSGTTT